MYSLIVVTAIFVAIIFNDLVQDNSSEIPKHALFGLVCVLSMTLLWYNDLALVGWGLLVVPIIVLLISFISLSLRTPSTLLKSGPSSTVDTCTTPVPTPVKSGSSCAPYKHNEDCSPLPATVSLPASLQSTGDSSIPSYSITPVTGC